MNNNFAIFVDSTSDMYTDLRKEYDIEYLNMDINVKGRVMHASLDWDLFSPKELYDWLRDGERITTNAVTFQEFSDKWTPVLESGRDILYLACSSALSASGKFGVDAAKELLANYPDRKILVIDCLNSCKGQGMISIRASELRASGKTIDEVYEIIEAEKLKYNQFCTVATLDYLKRAGRVKAGKAFFGNLFGIKPIIISDVKGNNYAWKKSKGRRQSLLDIIQYTKDVIENPEEQILYVSHADCIEDAEFLKEHLMSELHPKDVYIDYLGPIIGSTTGPGTVVIYSYGKAVEILGEE